MTKKIIIDNMDFLTKINMEDYPESKSNDENIKVSSLNNDLEENNSDLVSEVTLDAALNPSNYYYVGIIENIGLVDTDFYKLSCEDSFKAHHKSKAKMQAQRDASSKKSEITLDSDLKEVITKGTTLTNVLNKVDCNYQNKIFDSIRQTKGKILDKMLTDYRKKVSFCDELEKREQDREQDMGFC